MYVLIDMFTFYFYMEALHGKMVSPPSMEPMATETNKKVYLKVIIWLVLMAVFPS